MPSRTKKLRGSRTHGRGKKAGRGAGLIGGHGNAGLLKHKRLRMLKYDRDHFGRRGFKRPQCVVSANATMNVGEIQEGLSRLLDGGFARQEGDRYVVSLTDMGIDKLLGEGNVKVPMDIIVAEASASAKEKIESLGGTVVAE